MSRLDEALDREAEAWRPEPGDKVTGVVERVQIQENKYGRYPLLRLRTDDGRLVEVHGFHTRLKAELASVKPKVGETIGIKFRGDRGIKNVYKDYAVVVDRPDADQAEPDWSALGDQRLHLPVYDENDSSTWGEPPADEPPF